MYTGPPEEVQSMRRLLDDLVERVRLDPEVHGLIVEGAYTYRNRLRRMIEEVQETSGTGAGAR
jgi:hypothetical protein